jgi:hypothetical protein
MIDLEHIEISCRRIATASGELTLQYARFVAVIFVVIACLAVQIPNV